MTERRFSLIKVGAGDWLLPSNDASPAPAGWLWRFLRWEDGPELGAERRQTRWTVRRTPFTIDLAIGIRPDELDELPWEDVTEELTRTAAIERALNTQETTP